MAEEEANELSWLKSDSTKATNVEKPVPVARSRGEEKDDTPSWLFEDNDAKLAAAQEPTGAGGKPPKTTLSKLAGGIKWKQPMNRGKDLDEGSGDDDDEASCCGCCPGDPMLFSFQCFHFTAGMIGIAAFAANIYVFTQPYLTPKDAIMRSYALLFCLLVVIIEMDWRYVVNKIRFADLWVPRGLFYTLVGFVTFGITDETPKVSSTPQEIVGIMIWVVGICYIIMGMLCMKSMKQRRMIEVIQRGHARPGRQPHPADNIA